MGQSNLTLPEELVLAYEIDWEKEDLGQPVSVKTHWLFKLIGWLICVTSLLAALPAMFSDWQIGWSLIAVAFIGILLLVLTRQSIFVDQTKITVISSIVGRYQIRWQEITAIELLRGSKAFIFYGKNKWLVMRAHMPFASGSRQRLVRYLATAILEYRIPVTASNRVAPLMNNTRVSWW